MHNQTLPSHVTKYFWGDDITKLSLQNNTDYIIQTLLNIGDQKAIKWLFSEVEREFLKERLEKLTLDKRSSQFWRMYFS